MNKLDLEQYEKNNMQMVCTPNNGNNKIGSTGTEGNPITDTEHEIVGNNNF